MPFAAERNVAVEDISACPSRTFGRGTQTANPTPPIGRSLPEAQRSRRSANSGSGGQNRSERTHAEILVPENLAHLSAGVAAFASLILVMDC